MELSICNENYTTISEMLLRSRKISILVILYSKVKYVSRKDFFSDNGNLLIILFDNYNCILP